MASRDAVYPLNMQLQIVKKIYTNTAHAEKLNVFKDFSHKTNSV